MHSLITKPCRFTPFFVASWLVSGERKILQVLDLAGFGLDVSPFGSQLGGERGDGILFVSGNLSGGYSNLLGAVYMDIQ